MGDDEGVRDLASFGGGYIRIEPANLAGRQRGSGAALVVEEAEMWVTVVERVGAILTVPWVIIEITSANGCNCGLGVPIPVTVPERGVVIVIAFKCKRDVEHAVARRAVVNCILPAARIGRSALSIPAITEVTFKYGEQRPRR
jgi:hypothetical protein